MCLGGDREVKGKKTEDKRQDQRNSFAKIQRQTVSGEMAFYITLAFPLILFSKTEFLLYLFNGTLTQPGWYQAVQDH